MQIYLIDLVRQLARSVKMQQVVWVIHPEAARCKEREGGKDGREELGRATLTVLVVSARIFYFRENNFYIKNTRNHLFPPRSQLRVPLATKKHGVYTSPADTRCIFLSRTLVPAPSSRRFISSQRLRALSSTGCPISVIGLRYPGHLGGYELATPVSVKCFVITFQFAFEIRYWLMLSTIFSVSVGHCFSSWHAHSYHWPISWLT